MASKLGPQWKSVGIELDFQPHELDEISREVDHAYNRCIEMLTKWSKGEKATWDKLYKAMRILDRNAPAEEMKKSVMKLYK